MRRSFADASRLQEIHDAAVALGAECRHASHRRDGSAARKGNPDWQNEPRVPAGNPGGGQWTGDGDTEDSRSGTYDRDVEPVGARGGDTQAKKERFVDAHLADAQKVADQLGVPVENILGVAALESGWGTHPFAVSGNNYFGIHYPARFATGYMVSREGAHVATFASFADSLRSFVAVAGSRVNGKADPDAFAAALFSTGKFGVGKPGYAPSIARTIRGLRSLIESRRT